MRDLMAGIGFSETQNDLREVATGFCADVSPVSKVRDLIADGAGHDPSVWQQMVELGWLGIAVPEAQGGVGLDLGDVVPVVEQMGRRLMAGPYVDTILALRVLTGFAPQALNEQWVPELLAGKHAAIALTDPGGGYDPRAAGVSGSVDGDSIILSGRKILVTDGPEAACLLVSFRLNDEVRLGFLPVDNLAEGHFRRETVIDETRRSFEVDLDAASLPLVNVLDAQTSLQALKALHLEGALLAAAEMVGGSQACIDYTVDYLKTRTQFGKVIGSYQALKHPMVDAYAEYEKARSHLYSAAWVAGEQGKAEIAIRMAKAQAGKAMSFVADRSIQFHGGFGFTYDCDAQLYRRRAFWSGTRFGDGRYHKRALAKLMLTA